MEGKWDWGVILKHFKFGREIKRQIPNSASRPKKRKKKTRVKLRSSGLGKHSVAHVKENLKSSNLKYLESDSGSESSDADNEERSRRHSVNSVQMLRQVAAKMSRLAARDAKFAANFAIRESSEVTASFWGRLAAAPASFAALSAAAFASVTAEKAGRAVTAILKKKLRTVDLVRMSVGQAACVASCAATCAMRGASSACIVANKGARYPLVRRGDLHDHWVVTVLNRAWDVCSSCTDPAVLQWGELFVFYTLAQMVRVAQSKGCSVTEAEGTAQSKGRVELQFWRGEDFPPRSKSAKLGNVHFSKMHTVDVGFPVWCISGKMADNHILLLGRSCV